MTTLLLSLWFVALAFLFVVLACQPRRTRHSWSELNRRGDKVAIRRERLLGDIVALRRVVAGLLLVCLVLIGMALWQTSGVLLAIGAWLVAGIVARWRPLHAVAMKLYDSYEPHLLSFVESVPLIGRVLRDDTYIPHDQRLESIDHLLHLVDGASHVLSEDQRHIIRRGVSWHSTHVGSVMTKASDIISIKHNELLGPLVLDDLHKSGHYRFPVIKGSIDTIIGILDITDLLDVSSFKRSESVEQSMASDVLRVELDETLPAALKLLQKSRHHMLIVVDEDGKTAGIVTLADVTAALVGKTY